MGTVLELTELNFRNSLRWQNSVPTYSSFIFDESNNQYLGNLDDRLYNQVKTKLDASLRDDFVKIPINIHIDDASMVLSKVWKSGSVCGIQISGAQPGQKGNEHFNMILCLTPTMKISSSMKLLRG